MTEKKTSFWIIFLHIKAKKPQSLVSADWTLFFCFWTWVAKWAGGTSLGKLLTHHSSDPTSQCFGHDAHCTDQKVGYRNCVTLHYPRDVFFVCVSLPGNKDSCINSWRIWQDVHAVWLTQKRNRCISQRQIQTQLWSPMSRLLLSNWAI